MENTAAQNAIGTLPVGITALTGQQDLPRGEVDAGMNTLDLELTRLEKNLEAFAQRLAPILDMNKESKLEGMPAQKEASTTLGSRIQEKLGRLAQINGLLADLHNKLEL